ncbi:MAG: 3-deoxy-manno-octulosonate cytidylyltransferase [Candidatus Brocadiaceae bacterium]|nr:3-deoxy-manno-octulosonate cytidylyltransferase [Candidatus Brocadiaceae bacterium]
MKVVGIIPARLQSTRLPRKALIDIMGLPMIIHTYKRSQLSKKLRDVYVATDSEEIAEIVRSFNGKVIMTGSHHKTGSDRLAEACLSVDADIIVNIQGDEPLVYPEHIDAITEPLLADPSVLISVGVTPYKEKKSFSDIKAVLDIESNILYCSRTDIPSDARAPVQEMLKMCFIVPFRKKFLLQFASWSPTPLEVIEYNEYLRVLEHGIKLKAIKVRGASISVDTAGDLEKVRKLMENDTVRHFYS